MTEGQQDGGPVPDPQAENSHIAPEELFAGYARKIWQRVQERDKSATRSEFEPCLTASEKDPGAANHPGLVVLEFDWHFFKATVRFEQHTEYCTVSTLLDLSSEKGHPTYCKPEAPAKLCAIIDELNALEAMRDADEETRYGVNFRDQFSGISEAAFLTVWEEFHADVLLTDADEVNRLGEVFADFRGIVLSDEAEAGAARNSKVASAPKWFRFGKRAKVEEAKWFGIQRAFWRKDKTRRRVISKAPPNPDTYWKARYDLLWPLMTAKLRDIDFLNYEFTASMMSEGRALYLSALGAQPPNVKAVERIPLCYGLYTHQLGSWAIGRLIEQINQQGTLRLASLIDLPALQGAAVQLREAEQEVRIAFPKTISDEVNTGLNGRKRRGRRRSDKGSDRYSEKQIGELMASLDKAQTALGEADKLVPGGVAHRIERSRYYIRRFRDGLPMLDIKQFGDLQPYNVFVERRLGPTFGYIDMLWSRHDRVRRDMRALYQRVLAEETRNVAAAIRDRNTETEAIQIVADLALFAIILPYYIGSSVSHMAYPGSEHGMPNGYWLLIWFVFTAIAAARFPFDKWLPAGIAKWSKISMTGLLMLGSALLVWGMGSQRAGDIHIDIGWSTFLGAGKPSQTQSQKLDGVADRRGKANPADSARANTAQPVSDQLNSVDNTVDLPPGPQQSQPKSLHR